MSGSPWLEIPLEDYEAHMALPEVGQAKLLAELFGGLLERERPVSAALVGCAGGNGLERVDPATTRRVLAIDLNPHFLEAARMRHAHRLPGLELLAGDIQALPAGLEPVHLVFAGLLLEYVEAETALAGLAALCLPGGLLAVVLQEDPPGMPAVTPTRYESLRALSPVLRKVDPAVLGRQAVEAGISEPRRSDHLLPSGKRFLLLEMRRG